MSSRPHSPLQQPAPAPDKPPATPPLALPVPQKTPHKSLIAAQLASKVQCVSFSDSDNQERLRRFTISAQPSAVNIASDVLRKPLIQTSPQPASRNNSGVNEFLFIGSARPQPLIATTHALALLNSSSRVSLPVEGIRPQFALDLARGQLVLSPSPPPASLDLAQPIAVPARKNSLRKSNKIVVESPRGPPVPFQQFLSKEDDGKIHILLACTGSVATIKVPMIIDKLFQIYKNKISIQLVVTKSAGHFLKGLKIHNDVKIWRDSDEWANFNESIDYFTNHAAKKHKNPYDKLILHNELRKWADIMLIAPLSANTLAKIANGISDNLLTSIVRSWGWTSAATTAAVNTPQLSSAKKPILVAPAMNTFMYTHPLTAKQLDVLSSNEYGFGMEILKPVEKILVCGDIGMGGMREWSDVVDILRRRIGGLKTVKNKDIKEETEDDDDEEDDEEDDEDDEEEDDDDDDDDDDDENENDDIVQESQQ